MRLRPLVVAGLALAAGCSSNPPLSALRIEVSRTADAQSRCFVLEVRSPMGVVLGSSDAVAMDHDPPFRVGVASEGLPADVVLQAQAFSDATCTLRLPAEDSEAKAASFGSGVRVVTLELGLRASSDGGADAGADAGTDGGATDAGHDAGLVDADHDGFSPPDDCDDTNAGIHPGAVEQCSTLGVDEDCDGYAGCDDPDCLGLSCSAFGRCEGGACDAGQETGLCDNGLDDDHDDETDCADQQDCDGQACDAGFCTVGATCGGASCQGTARACQTDHPCWQPVGTCNEGQRRCDFAVVPDGTACDAGAACLSATCQAGACVAVSACAAPASCHQPGTCNTASGLCEYPLADAGAPCDDQDVCTSNACSATGVCQATPLVCTPTSECRVGSCAAGVGCQFDPVSGGACGDGGTCVAGVCQAAPRFPLLSNFTEAQFGALTGLPSVNLTCPTAGLDTGSSGADFTASGCASALLGAGNVAVITQVGGTEALLVGLQGLTVAAGTQLTLSGARPVIFAVDGPVVLAGTVLAANGDGSGCSVGAASVRGGGGGGGFGKTGAAGGDSENDANSGASGGTPVGNATLTPLRGGCPGSAGAGPAPGTGGAPGGALQVTGSGTVTVSGVLLAPGGGGAGAQGRNVVTGGSGGGGAGSGGGVLLEASALWVTGLVAANGGGGGEGSTTNTGVSGTTAGTGFGNGGSGGTTLGGNGGHGGDRNDAQKGSNAAGQTGYHAAGAGGGGGAAGRIHLRAALQCDVSDAGLVFSPAATSGGPVSCSQL